MKKLFLFGVFALGLLYTYRVEVKDAIFEARKNLSLPAETKSIEVVSLSKKAGQTSILTVPAEETAVPLPPSVKPETAVEEINLDVPFSTQAPHANWAMPYQEACEEASALLVHRFYTGENLTPDIADQELLKIIEWEKQTFGYYEHTTAEETARILREYFGHAKVEVRYDFTIDDLKREVAAGRPIVVPFAGRELGNPNYRQPGPVYHMLVVKGFTKDGRIITNDVGTRRGHNYVYDPQILFNAIHDVPSGGSMWNVSDPAQHIKTGRKAMIVVF